MHAHRFLSAAIVTAALLAPVAASAAATPAGAPETTQKRVYDRSHKDYHVWDSNEDQAYRAYLGDQHIKYPQLFDAQPQETDHVLELPTHTGTEVES